MVLTESLNKETIDEALSLTGVIHLKDKNLGDLSGGEFQRVLLARAISKKPELLVLDEHSTKEVRLLRGRRSAAHSERQIIDKI
jgi:ABC-type Mn/Zn transport systems, ATPase component